MKKLLICSLFILFSIFIYSQSFEVVYSTKNSEIFRYSFQDIENNLITVGSGNSESGPSKAHPIVIKIDETGNIINEKEFPKADTSYNFEFGFQKTNGNYFFMGILTDEVPSTDCAFQYYCELTSGFELVWEKTHRIPPEYNNNQLLEFLLTPDSNFLIQGRVDSSLYSFNHLLYISKINMQGDLLEFKLYEGWTDDNVYGEFIYKYDSSGFYLIGNYPHNSFSREWVELDLELNIIDYGIEMDPEHYIDSPVSAKYLSNGNLLLANQTTIEPGTFYDLYIRITDSDFNTLIDTLLIFDEKVNMPVKKGLGFIDENNIWIATFESSTISWPGTEVFRVFILDSELNMKGFKVYGGDTRYYFYDLTVTSDGGCVVTGMVPDYEGSDNHDGYVIKVTTEDILSIAEETLCEYDKDVWVYPNPFNEYFNIETVRKGLKFILYSEGGNKIAEKNLINQFQTSLQTTDLNPGVYLYSISDNDHVIQSGKLIKQ